MSSLDAAKKLHTLKKNVTQKQYSIITSVHQILVTLVWTDMRVRRVSCSLVCSNWMRIRLAVYVNIFRSLYNCKLSLRWLELSVEHATLKFYIKRKKTRSNLKAAKPYRTKSLYCLIWETSECSHNTHSHLLSNLPLNRCLNLKWQSWWAT